MTNNMAENRFFLALSAYKKRNMSIFGGLVCADGGQLFVENV